MKGISNRNGKLLNFSGYEDEIESVRFESIAQESELFLSQHNVDGKPFHDSVPEMDSDFHFVSRVYVD